MRVVLSLNAPEYQIMEHLKKYAEAGLLLAGALYAFHLAAQSAPVLTTLFTFTGATGGAPACALVGDPSGALYGTAGGGATGAGVVFKLTPPAGKGGGWTESVLYNFTGKTDGGGPGNGLILDKSGALYGAAYQGGASGFGAVFQLKPPASPGGAWTENVLFSFAGRRSGANPHPPLTFGGQGQLYGVAGGGSPGYGVVFELTPPAGGTGPWTEKVLHQFMGAGDGATPAGAVVMGSHGILYGMTNFGGAYNAGTVYQVKPPSQAGGAWAETVLYSFNNSNDGSFPVGALVFNPSGTAFGTTSAGGKAGFGTVFQLTPPSAAGGAWTETVLYSFLNGIDGSSPTGTLVFGPGGALYGTTAVGGAKSDGTIFQLSPPASSGSPWTQIVLHSFSGLDGQNPYYGVMFAKTGALYGTTEFGGATGLGTVFQLTP